MNEELKKFYEYIRVVNTYNCVNTINNGVFSKNIFVNNLEQINDFFKINKFNDCYINYQPLKDPINRKTENVSGVSLLAFDIECSDKKSPETDKKLKKLYEYIKLFISQTKIENYMIVFSGNGFHLYIDIGKKIKKDTYIMKEAYKQIIKEYSKFLYNISSGFVNADDRKDLAGILRIPGTYNNKAKKFVKLIEISNNNENKIVRKKFLRITRRLNFERKLINNYEGETNFIFPKTIDELLNNPLVEILFDKDLPESVYGSRHTSIIFALQSLIYHSGLKDKYEIKELTREVNLYCGISVDLSTCSNTESFIGPLLSAIKYCEKNGYNKYVEKLKKFKKESFINK